MRRTSIVFLGVLLISGSVAQMAAASEHHQKRSGAYFGRDVSEIRNSYDQAGTISVAPQALDRFDPTTPRDQGPVLNPPGS